MNTPLCLPALLIAGACASQPPSEALADRQYHRDAARIEAVEEFQRDKAACHRQAGTMVLNRTFSPRIRSSRAEVRLATCAPGRLGAIL